MCKNGARFLQSPAGFLTLFLIRVTKDQPCSDLKGCCLPKRNMPTKPCVSRPENVVFVNHIFIGLYVSKKRTACGPLIAISQAEQQWFSY